MDKFGAAYSRLLREKNPIIHRQAIQSILSKVDLAEHFDALLEKKDGVNGFFLFWERAGKEEKNPKEKEELKKLGALSKKLYEIKDYKGLCELFFNLTFRHFAEVIKLKERDDFDKITDIDLYNTNGYRWWKQKLKEVINEVGVERAVNEVLVLEYFPYHSKRFKPINELLKSQQYNTYLLREIMKEGKIVIIMRAERYWLEMIPELRNYNYYKLKSSQNVAISKRNLLGDFDRVISSIK